MMLNWVFIGLPTFIMFMTMGFVLMFLIVQFVHFFFFISSFIRQEEEKLMGKQTFKKRVLEFLMDSLMFLIILGIVIKLLTFLLAILERGTFI